MNFQDDRSNISSKDLYDNQSSLNMTTSSYWINTSVFYLSLLSIVKEIIKVEIFYGSVTFSVQINEEFEKTIQKQLNNSFESE